MLRLKLNHVSKRGPRALLIIGSFTNQQLVQENNNENINGSHYLLFEMGTPPLTGGSPHKWPGNAAGVPMPWPLHNLSNESEHLEFYTSYFTYKG